MNNYPAITARIIADTVSRSARITSFEVEFPRPYLAEVNTHGVLAKSTASSRAIPIRKRREDVLRRPYTPIFTKHKAGMQADGYVDEASAAVAAEAWGKLAACAVGTSEILDEVGVHKQHANRVLETFIYSKTILTGTEWSNFFRLRNSSEAQPEFEELAFKMKAAYDISVPFGPTRLGGMELHLPYCDVEADQLRDPMTALRISAARCARVSYRSLETGIRSTYAEDSALAEKLAASGHFSPFDHPAIADCLSVHDEVAGHTRYTWNNPRDHRRFYGWIPYRAPLERELGIVTRRDSFAPFALPVVPG
jgi:Thymidylate synthase complementing protein